MWPSKTPNEHLDRVPKNDTVNMRTGRGGDPGGQTFELSWGAAAPDTKHKGNQYYGDHDNTHHGG